MPLIPGSFGPGSVWREAFPLAGTAPPAFFLSELESDAGQNHSPLKSRHARRSTTLSTDLRWDGCFSVNILKTNIPKYRLLTSSGDRCQWKQIAATGTRCLCMASTSKCLSKQRGGQGQNYPTRYRDNPLQWGRTNRCLCPSQKEAEN